MGLKLTVRVGDPTKRVCKPFGVGPVYTGSPRHYNNVVPISFLGCATYAGAIVLAHPRIYINNKNMAMHAGKCTCGFTLSGAPRLLMS